jgi:hypothetical protein
MNTYNVDSSLEKVVVKDVRDVRDIKHESIPFMTSLDSVKDLNVASIKNSYAAYNPITPLPSLQIQNQMMQNQIMQSRGFTPVHGSNGIIQPSTLNLNLNINKNTKKDELPSNKRTIPKKSGSRNDFSNKFKNDGQNDGDGEGEDDEEDPDLALFNNLEKKKSSMSPSTFPKANSLISGQAPSIKAPVSTAFEFQKLKNHAASPASLDPNLVKMKPMNEVEKSIVNKPTVKEEEMKIPGTGKSISYFIYTVLQ